MSCELPSRNWRSAQRRVALEVRGLMTLITDDGLYVRGIATLLASWEKFARGSAGAALERLNGVSAAVFPSAPERLVYNNALLDRDLGPAERAAAVDAMEATYGSAGVERYAAWVHESDEGMRAELGSRGYTVEEYTRAMGMSLGESRLRSPRSSSGRRTGAGTCGSSAYPPACCRRRPKRASPPRSAARRRERRDRDGLRPRRRQRCVQRVHTRGGAAARARHRAHRTSRPRRRRTWLLDRKPAVQRDGRAGLRGGWVPRRRPDPRIRAVRVGPAQLRTPGY